MKAVVFEAFSAPPTIQTVADPTPENHGVVVKVMATGVCRSDWHGWVGHDTDIELPHVPGHELAGIVEAVGKDVTRWKVGDRITVPFVGGCGACSECSAGQHQVCDRQFQPGFTHWGSFAEYVSLHQADINLVALPESLDFTTAASLGCRFVTSFRAVVDQGQTRAGQWVAIDIAEDKLELARSLGAVATVNASRVANVVEAVRDITQGGAHVSLDALGHPTTCFNSISNLRKRGKHVQVGLMLGEHSTPIIPMSTVIAKELEILGSHGMQAHRYDAMFAMMQSGKLAPQKLIGRTISLEQSIEALMNMDKFEVAGVTVVDRF